MIACRHCKQGIYNDSDSHPQDPNGPWAEIVTTEYQCPRSPDGHRP